MTIWHLNHANQPSPALGFFWRIMMQPKNKAAERAAYDNRGLVWMTGDVLSRENLAFSDGHETGWAAAETHFTVEIERLKKALAAATKEVI